MKILYLEGEEAEDWAAKYIKPAVDAERDIPLDDEAEIFGVRRTYDDPPIFE